MYKDTGSGSGSGWVSLGGYAKQISASLDATGKAGGLRDRSQRRPLVQSRARLGQPGRLRDGGQRPAVDVGLAGDLAYAVAKGHGGLLHQGASFVSLGGGTIE